MVEHQSLPWSSPSLVQELKVFPCQVKGNTQGFPAAGPDTVLQVRLKSAAAVVVEVGGGGCGGCCCGCGGHCGGGGSRSCCCCGSGRGCCGCSCGTRAT